MAKKQTTKAGAKKNNLATLLTQGYYASATFINDCPANWGVTITQVGCKFMDDDGNNDDKSKNTNIPGGGGSDTLNSSYQGCCRSYFVVMQVLNQGQTSTYANATTVEPGYCGGNLKWHLVPKS